MTTVAPEEARAAHSIGSALRTGVRVWYPLVGGVVAWMIHLVFFAGFVRFTCTAMGYLWAMHLVTVACLAVTGAALLLSVALTRQEGREDEPNEGGRLQFLGRLGVIVGVASALLIGLEELYVFVLRSKRCV